MIFEDPAEVWEAELQASSVPLPCGGGKQEGSGLHWSEAKGQWDRKLALMGVKLEE
jgi:hypothetical protein